MRDGKITYIFRPHKRGLNRFLGELEKDIMEILWKNGRLSVKEVWIELLKSKKMAYTTIMTVMGRLAQKGLLLKEKEGKSYYYTPKYKKDEFMDKVSREVFLGMLENQSSKTLASFVDVLTEKDPRIIEELSKLIEEKRNQQGKNSCNVNAKP